MSRTRRLFVQAALVLFVAASAAATITKHEVYPILRYPMYSGVQHAGPISFYYLYGVTAEGREVRMEDPLWLAPFKRQRLRTALGRMRVDSLRTVGLLDVLSRYEVRRRAGAHDGPRLLALRRYRYTWDSVGPDFVPGTPPDERVLTLEVRVP